MGPSPDEERRRGAVPSELCIADLEREHGELAAALDGLSPKAAAIRLLHHARRLPDLKAAPQTLFYHTDVLTRIAAVLLAPYPFTAHPALLADLLGALEAAPTRHASLRRDDIREASARAAALLAAECAVGRDWDRMRALRARYHATTSPRREPSEESGGVSPAQRIERVIGELAALPCCAGMHWPYHLRNPADLPRDVVLTVLVDTEAVPPRYREAYLAALSVTVEAQKTKTPGPPIVRSQDERGEDLPLGEGLKATVCEAVDRAVAFLGPSARARVLERQLNIGMLLRNPAPIPEIDGRSVMLPLVLALARGLGEQLNLSARLDPAPATVWTGDVERGGAITSVSDVPLKCTRIAWSRVEAFGFPEADGGVVQETLGHLNHDVRLLPLAHVLDVGETPGSATITRRGVLTRAGFEVRRRARPLGIAGVVAAGILLASLGFATRHLASWLDTKVAGVRVTKSGDHVELLNSYERVVRTFKVTKTVHASIPALGDVDGDAIAEVFTGTGALDTIPSTLFCYDQHGRLRWSFRGGFRADEPILPEFARYANTFSAGGAYVHDVDRDGTPEVFAVFNHTPNCATQIARLTSDGRYVSSFWHYGHCGSINSMSRDLTFDDFDRDGYDEIIVAGTLNRCNRAVVIVLDPRSFQGSGHMCGRSDTTRTWQSYVLLGDCEDVRRALRMPRLHAYAPEVRHWSGQRVLMAKVSLVVDNVFEGAFTYRLDRDLNVVDFYWADWFAGWADSARTAGALSSEWTLARFDDQMRQIEVIPGPQWLWEPDRAEGAAPGDTSLSTDSVR